MALLYILVAGLFGVFTAVLLSVGSVTPILAFADSTISETSRWPTGIYEFMIPYMSNAVFGAIAAWWPGWLTPPQEAGELILLVAAFGMLPMFLYVFVADVGQAQHVDLDENGLLAIFVLLMIVLAPLATALFLAFAVVAVPIFLLSFVVAPNGDFTEATGATLAVGLSLCAYYIANAAVTIWIAQEISDWRLLPLLEWTGLVPELLLGWT